MPKLVIEEKGCRGCSLCADVCPTKVFEMEADQAKAKRPDDCIGCTSCVYICPSRCITVEDYIPQRLLYRIEQNSALVERFLQKKTLTQALTEADFDMALKDVGVRLLAVGEAADSTLGRGAKSMGRRSGALMAEHIPEMYEAANLEEALERLKARFVNCFDFQAQVEGNGEVVTLRFSNCALSRVVQSHGGTVGTSLLCTLFHEYWGGLVGAFNNKKYTVTESKDGTCGVRLEARA